MATTLAALHAGRGRDVLLVNTDPQNTAGFWADERKTTHPEKPPVHCVSLKGNRIHSELADLAGRYGCVVVDAGGRDSVELRSALVVTDLLVIPLRPSQFDVWTLEKMDALVDQAAAINQGLTAWILMNQVPPVSRDRFQAEMRKVTGEWPRFRLMRAMLLFRATYANAGSEGLAVNEMERRDAKACAETSFLYQEIFDALEAEKVA